MKNIVSLFDYTGTWVEDYASLACETGEYDVYCIDLEADGIDIADIGGAWLMEHLPADIHGLVAAPPCTHFSASGARWWAAKDGDGRTAQAIHLVRQVLRTVSLFEGREADPDDPDEGEWPGLQWWCLENPVGRLARLVPELGRASCYVEPWWWGDPWTKKTGLWGDFNPPARRPDLEVDPIPEYMSKTVGVPRAERARFRSTTPRGFARAFFEANP